MRLAPALILVGLCSAFFQDVPLDLVATHNDALGATLMGISTNIYGVPEKTPNSADPLSYFGVKIHAVYPSVDFWLAGEKSPRVAWSYGYAVGGPFSQGNTDACGAKKSTLSYAGDDGGIRGFATLDGAFTKSQDRLDGIWNLPFSSGELSNGSSLVVWLDWSLTLRYLETNQTAVCRVECTRAGCWTYKDILESKSYKYFGYYTKTPAVNYRIANASGRAFLFQPFFSKRSLRTPWFDAYAVSNATVSAWRFTVEGQTAASGRFFGFKLNEDAFGIQNITTFAVRDSVRNLQADVEPLSSSVYTDAFKLRVHHAKTGTHAVSFSFQDVLGRVYGQDTTVQTYAEAFLTLNVSPTFLADSSVSYSARLTDALGLPLSGRNVRVTSGSFSENLVTGAAGTVSGTLRLPAGVQVLEAHFFGSDDLPQAYARKVVYIEPLAALPGFPVRFDWLFLPALLVLGMAATRLD